MSTLPAPTRQQLIASEPPRRPTKLTPEIIKEVARLIRGGASKTIALEHTAINFGIRRRTAWNWWSRGQELAQHIDATEEAFENGQQLPEDQQLFEEDLADNCLLYYELFKNIQRATSDRKLLSTLSLQKILRDGETEQTFKVTTDDRGREVKVKTGEKVKHTANLARVIMQYQEREWPEEFKKPLEQLEVKGGLVVEGRVGVLDIGRLAEGLSEKMGREVTAGEVAVELLRQRRELESGAVEVDEDAKELSNVVRGRYRFIPEV